MKLGVREICEVVFRAKAKQKFGNKTFYKNEPVIYFDSLKTSSLEGAATTVYATGGRGNSRLIAWEGERTLTFNMEDALISPVSFSILSGAGLTEASQAEPAYVHSTYRYEIEETGKVELPNIAAWNGGRDVATGEAKPNNGLEHYHKNADIFCMLIDPETQEMEAPSVPASVTYADGKTTLNVCDKAVAGKIVLVDYYVEHEKGVITIDITPDQFGGFYYVEASTLFRREADGKDLPAEFIIPRAKVQSNFTFTMAATGDPSTFNFVLDAFPDYTKFDQTKKVLAALQVIDEEDADDEEKARDNCTPAANFDEAVTSPATGVTVKATKDTDAEYAATVSGADVLPEYDEDTFGDLGDVNAVEIQMDLHLTPGEQYTIVQTNPVLENYLEDSRVSQIGSNFVKKQTITAPAADEKFQMLVQEAPAVATVKVYSGATENLANLVRTYTITSDLRFA